MHFAFEDWISSQKISETPMGLFEEGIACYKASAFRASLLLSYLGFQTVVRDRMLMSKCPSGITGAQWNGIIDKLGDDDKWDAQIYDAIQTKSPGAIFKLSEDVRNQTTFWKNRRNDCAHSKRNEIDYCHVESFWLFVKSNLAKFVVSGSKEGLLNDIRTHFDRSLTATGTDCSFILEQIPDAVEADELMGFFRSMYQILGELAADPSHALLDDALVFVNRIFALRDPAVVERLVEFLKTEELLIIALLRRNPERLLYFANDESFIRKLWYDRLFRPKGQNDFPLYCSLLRNNSIPKNQLDEAHRRVISLLRHSIPTDECIQTLEASGFFGIFKDQAFMESGGLISEFGWANGNCDLVVLYLERYGIDSNVAYGLGGAFAWEHHPWHLRKAINAFLFHNPDKRREFLNVFTQNQIGIPEYLDLREEEAKPSEPPREENDDLPF